MNSHLFQARDNHINAAVYVDYENIALLLGRYGVDPLEIGFFPVILRELREKHRLTVVDFVVYGNFERQPFNNRHQTLIRSLGIETRHSANNGKNSGDLELTVDALRTLYKNPGIRVFVLISSDRDIIPLLKAIRYENRFAYVLSTRNGFNQVIKEYADHHEYIEDLFGLDGDPLEIGDNEALRLEAQQLRGITGDETEKARLVCRLLYSSKIWARYKRHGDAVSMSGYAAIVARTVGESPKQVMWYFRLAHHFNYITIYRHARKGLCLREGKRWTEVLG